MTVVPNAEDDRRESSQRQRPRLRLGASPACQILLIFGLLCGGAFLWQVVKTHNLRTLAASIRVGEPIADVDARLGGSKYGYESGWPKPGAPPAKQGLMFGGAADELHEAFDSQVGRFFRNTIGRQPSWYGNMFSKQKHDWPVVVKFDHNDEVSAVYVDGKRITSSVKDLKEP